MPIAWLIIFKWTWTKSSPDTLCSLSLVYTRIYIYIFFSIYFFFSSFILLLLLFFLIFNVISSYIRLSTSVFREIPHLFYRFYRWVKFFLYKVCNKNKFYFRFLSLASFDLHFDDLQFSDDGAGESGDGVGESE